MEELIGIIDDTLACLVNNVTHINIIITHTCVHIYYEIPFCHGKFNMTSKASFKVPNSLYCGIILSDTLFFNCGSVVLLLCCSFCVQVTWLEGHSLAQTVFTNLYMHDPYLVEDRALKAFCVCLLKMVDIVRDRVNRAAVFEEVSWGVVKSRPVKYFQS